MGDKKNKKSFWTTLPGILTGSAALLTAIGGLITIIIVSDQTQEPPPAPKPVINSFTASPSSISAGEISTLSWSVSDAIDVTIDQGIGRVESAGTKVVSPTESITYTLIAKNDAGSDYANTQVTVKVDKPTINYFTANPSSISAGEVSTLSWSVSDTEGVTIDQGIGGVESTGTRVVSPTETTTYTLTAENKAGSVYKTTQVIVEQKPVINSFTASPSSISTGENCTLRWSVSDAVVVTIDQGIGRVALTGTRVVSPAENTTYTLTAENEAGSVNANTQVTVEQKPVINSFTASPSSISAGEISTLSWSVSDAEGITIDQGIGSVALTGTRMVSPIENTTYTLTAENEAGSVYATIQVTIEVSNPVIVGDPPKSQIGNHTPPTFNTTSMIFTLNATDNDSGIAEGIFNPVGGFAVSVWGYNEHFGGFYLFGDTTNGNVEEDFSLILGSNDAGQVGRYRLMADVNANNPLRYVDPSKGYYFRIVNQNGEVTFIGAGGEQFISEEDVQLNTILFGSDTIGP